MKFRFLKRHKNLRTMTKLLFYPCSVTRRAMNNSNITKTSIFATSILLRAMTLYHVTQFILKGYKEVSDNIFIFFTFHTISIMDLF